MEEQNEPQQGENPPQETHEGEQSTTPPTEETAPPPPDETPSDPTTTGQTGDGASTQTDAGVASANGASSPAPASPPPSNDPVEEEDEFDKPPSYSGPTEDEVKAAFAEMQAGLDHLKTSSNVDAPGTIVYNAVRQIESGFNKLKSFARL